MGPKAFFDDPGVCILARFLYFKRRKRESKFAWTLQRDDLESDLPRRPPEVSLRAALPPVGLSRRTLLEDASVAAQSSRPSWHQEDSDFRYR